jgi:hypothetical protein
LGSVYSEAHINLTAHTALFAKNWYRDGPLRLKFASIGEPLSIENQHRKRNIYISWPPGYILPIYLAAKIKGLEPSITTVQNYNLLGHFLTAYFLALTAFFFMIRIGSSYYTSLFLSVIPIVIILFTPANLWFLQMVFMAQQAVIPLFALFVLLEILRDFPMRKSRKRIINTVQIFIFFYGALTAYIFYMIGFIVYIKRLMTREIRYRFFLFIKDSLIFWAPAILSASLFALQITLLKQWPHLIFRGRIRSGLTGFSDFWLKKFWNTFFSAGYGSAGKYLIWGSTALFITVLIVVLVRRFRHHTVESPVQEILFLMGILLLPCFMQIYLFKNHSWGHQYTIVKFSLPLSLIPFILGPLLLARLMKPFLGKLTRSLGFMFKTSPERIKAFISAAAVIILFSGGLFYALSIHTDYKNYFTENRNLEAHNARIQPYHLVGRNTRFEDIVVSPGVEVAFRNKAPMVYTMKTIYKTNSIYDIHSLVWNLQQNYRVNILVNDQDLHPPFYIQKLIENADNNQKSGHWHLYQLKKESFLSQFSVMNKKAERQAYFQQRQEFRNSTSALIRALQKDDLYPALGHLNRMLAFFENHNAARYNQLFYQFKLILLHRLNKHTEASILEKKIQNLPHVYEVERIWGWNPYSWLRFYKAD